MRISIVVCRVTLCVDVAIMAHWCGVLVPEVLALNCGESCRQWIPTAVRLLRVR